MPSSPFVGEWIITNWTPDTTIQVPHGIPPEGFRAGDLLNITQPDPNVNSFNLQWTDQEEQTSSVSDLQSNGAQTELQGQRPVSFVGEQDPVTCNLLLNLTSTDPKQLEGHIAVASSGFPETGAGTFTAEANPGGADDGRKH